MKAHNTAIAVVYHLFFSVIGIAGIAIIPYRLWDIKTAVQPDEDGMLPVVALAVVMIGFSIYGLLFRERIYPKFFGRELNQVLASENLLIGLFWVLLGLVISAWTNYIAIGAVLWGALQAVHGVVQVALRAGKRGHQQVDCDDRVPHP